MTEKLKQAAIEFLAELEASLAGWKDEVESPEKDIRVSELKCVLNCVGAINLRQAMGAVAVRKAHKMASTWWEAA